MSPEAYLAFSEASEGIDVTPLLPSVRTSTLVVHDKSDAFGDFSALARNIAAQIAGARLVSTDDPPAAVDQFLREGGEYAPSMVLLAQSAEFTFLLLDAGVADDAVSRRTFSLTVSAVGVSVLLTPLLATFAGRVAEPEQGHR